MNRNGHSLIKIIINTIHLLLKYLKRFGKKLLLDFLYPTHHCVLKMCPFMLVSIFLTLTETFNHTF